MPLARRILPRRTIPMRVPTGKSLSSSWSIFPKMMAVDWGIWQILRLTQALRQRKRYHKIFIWPDQRNLVWPCIVLIFVEKTSTYGVRVYGV